MEQQEQAPLTPGGVERIEFDRAPVHRRGYHEGQVDEFLDRVLAALSGTGSLTVSDVEAVEFDAAPLIRRGYHEGQVDEFLDRVVEELRRRARARARQAALPKRTAGTHANGFSHPPRNGTPVPPPNGTPPPGAPVPPTGGVPVAPISDALGPRANGVRRPRPNSSPAAPTRPVHPAEPVRPAPTAEPTRPVQPAERTRPTPPAPPQPAPRGGPSRLALPLPPTPAHEPGYRAADVALLVQLITNAINGSAGGTPSRAIAACQLSVSPTPGAGYHTDAVDSLRFAWIAELRRQGR